MALTPMKAIRKKCLECSGGQPKEVRLCVIPSCALYPYRMGHRPEKTMIDIEDYYCDVTEWKYGVLRGFFTKKRQQDWFVFANE